jgi:hypothetical protein
MDLSPNGQYLASGERPYKGGLLFIPVRIIEDNHHHDEYFYHQVGGMTTYRLFTIRTL